MALPKYQLLEKAFLEPHILKPGDIIEWTGEPGPHMKPLNPEAEARLEAYFQHKPHMRFGLNGSIENLPRTMEVPIVNILATAVVDPKEKVLSVAEMAAQGPQATDQRPQPIAIPGAAKVVKPDPNESADTLSIAAALKRQAEADKAAEADMMEATRATEEAKAKAKAEEDAAAAKATKVTKPPVDLSSALKE